MNKLILLSACIFVSILSNAQVTNKTSRVDGQPTTTNTETKSDDVKKLRESFNGSFKELMTEIKSVNNTVNSISNEVCNVKEKMSSESSIPPKNDTWVGVLLVIGLLFNIALISCLGLVLFTLSKMRKNEQVQNDEIKRLVNLGNQKIEKKLDEVQESGIDNKSVNAIVNGVEARLKIQFDNLRKIASTDSQKEVLEKMRILEKFIQTESSCLREQERKVIEADNELKMKIADAERKIKEADMRIANCERDKNAAVEQAKAQVRVACQSESQSIKEQLMKMQSSLATANAEAAQAEALGFEKGVKEERERNRNLERENENLKIKVASVEKTLAEANSSFAEKLSVALNEKDENLKRVLAERQISIQKECDEKYSSKITLLEKSNQEKDLAVMQLTKEKSEANEDHKRFEEASKKQIQDGENKLKEVSETLEKKIEALVSAKEEIKNLQINVYPASFLADNDFTTLKEHLEGWLTAKIPGAEIVKSSLGLFAQREYVNTETWQLALRNISLGISSSMRMLNESPNAICAELGLWSKFLMKFSDDKFDFSLQMSSIGASVDPSWMTSKVKNLVKITAVLSWAVWNNQFGVRYNAEVE